MDDMQWKSYLCDLGQLVKEYALDAAAEREKHRHDPEKEFYDGYVLGFHRIVSLMQQQAEAFNIDPLYRTKLKTSDRVDKYGLLVL